MKLSNIFGIGTIGALLLVFSSAAMANVGKEVLGGQNLTFTASNAFDGYTTAGLLIDNLGSATVNGSQFAGNSGIAIENNGTVIITGAQFVGNSGNSIQSTGTTTINSATFTGDSGNLIDAVSGTTTVYGATLTGNSGLDFVTGGGVIDLYGNFGALNGTSITTAGSKAGSFSGILQNDGTKSYSFDYQITNGGIINFLPAPVTSTPEPSALTVFAIAGIALAGFAGMRRRVRA